MNPLPPNVLPSRAKTPGPLTFGLCDLHQCFLPVFRPPSPGLSGPQTFSLGLRYDSLVLGGVVWDAVHLGSCCSPPCRWHTRRLLSLHSLVRQFSSYPTHAVSLENFDECRFGSPTVVFKGQNYKDGFSELALKFWNWLSNLIRFKNADDCVCYSRKSTHSLWHKLFIERCRISALSTPSQHLQEVRN